MITVCRTIAFLALTCCLLIGLTSCSFAPSRVLVFKDERRAPAQTSMRLLEPEASPIGLALVVHGLNTKSDAMLPFANVLVGSGFRVGLLGLSNHTDNSRHQLELSEEWLRQVESARRALTQTAPTLPLLGVGYSLGATLLAELHQYDTDSAFTGFIFFAPAFKLRGSSNLIRFLARFSATGLALPSLTPELYRARATTSLAAYRALFTLVDDLDLSSQKLFSTPALVIVAADDELIDVESTRKMIAQTGGGNWTLETVKPKGAYTTYHHLILDVLTLGLSEWEGVTSKLREFALAHCSSKTFRRWESK